MWELQAKTQVQLHFISLSRMSKELIRSSTDKICMADSAASTRQHVTGEERAEDRDVLDSLRNQTATYS